MLPTDERRLIELLAIPLVVEVAAVRLADGDWVRRASYPELPDCQADAATVEEALDLLEFRRIAELKGHVTGSSRFSLPEREVVRDLRPEALERLRGDPPID